MNWLNLNVPKVLRSEEFLGSDPVERSTWICLSGYCAQQENGGVIEACAEWKDRKWQQIVGVTKSEANIACSLYWMEDGSLHVWGYPRERETDIRAKSISGKLGGRSGLNKEQLAELKGKLSLEQIASLSAAQVADLRHAGANAGMEKLAELIANLSAQLQRKGKGNGKKNWNGKDNEKGNCKEKEKRNCNRNARGASASHGRFTDVNYPPTEPLPEIEDYADIYAITDPIVAALAVTRETQPKGFMFWVRLRDAQIRAGKPEDDFDMTFFESLAEVYGETRAGEVRNPGAILTNRLKDRFGCSPEMKYGV